MPSTPFPRRTGALAGLLCVLLFVASLALPGILGQHHGASLVTPYSTDTEVARYLAVSDSSEVPVSAFCQALSALALLLFAPCAADYVHRLDRSGIRPALVRTAGTVAGALLLLSACFQWILNRPTIGGSLPTYRAVMDLAFVTGGAAQVATTGLLIGAVAAAARRSRALPGWLNWLGLAVAAASTAAMLSLLLEPASALIPLGRFAGMIWLLGLATVWFRTGVDGRQTEGTVRLPRSERSQVAPR